MKNECYGCKQRIRSDAKFMLVRITRWSGTIVKTFHYRCGQTAINMSTNEPEEKRVLH